MTVAPSVRVAIVVLGEIAQCPRMQLHARSLAEKGALVDVISYAGPLTPAWLRSHPRIRLWPLPAPGWARRHDAPRMVFTVYSLARIARVSWTLFWTLAARTPSPDIVLLQTPPSIPALPLSLLAARFRGALTVIDWHNYGYTILGLHLGSQHWAVRLMAWAERAFGRHAGRHLCVSQAMRRDLAARWGIPDAVVLYDQPADQFHEPMEAERRRVRDTFARLVPQDMTLSRENGDPDRPAFLISPTSWTVDEDFTLLLNALEHCDAEIAREEEGTNDRIFPDIVVLITGNGPTRSIHEQRIASLVLHRISIRTAWFSEDDFPVVLGCCDLGICLHTPSKERVRRRRPTNQSGGLRTTWSPSARCPRAEYRYPPENPEPDGCQRTSAAAG